MRETPNADESRTGENRILLGDSEHNEVEALKAALQGQKVRANAVLGVEMLISASPEYFRPFSPENAGEYDGYRLHNWVGAQQTGYRKNTATVSFPPSFISMKRLPISTYFSFLWTIKAS